MNKEEFLVEINTLFQEKLKSFRLKMIIEDLTDSDVELLQGMYFTNIKHEIDIEGYFDRPYSVLQHKLEYKIKLLEEWSSYFLSMPAYTRFGEKEWYHDGYIDYHDIDEHKLYPQDRMLFSKRFERNKRLDEILEMIFEEIGLLEKVEEQYAHEEVTFLETKEKEMMEFVKEGTKVEVELNESGIQYRIHQNNTVKIINHVQKKFEM